MLSLFIYQSVILYHYRFVDDENPLYIGMFLNAFILIVPELTSILLYITLYYTSYKNRIIVFHSFR